MAGDLPDLDRWLSYVLGSLAVGIHCPPQLLKWLRDLPRVYMRRVSVRRAVPFLYTQVSSFLLHRLKGLALHPRNRNCHPRTFFIRVSGLRARLSMTPEFEGVSPSALHRQFLR